MVYSAGLEIDKILIPVFHLATLVSARAALMAAREI